MGCKSRPERREGYWWSVPNPLLPCRSLRVTRYQQIPYLQVDLLRQHLR